MFLLTSPDENAVERFLHDRENDSFSYEEVGATAGNVPAGYNIDHNRIRIGTGESDFERAIAAVRGWKMFDIKWVELIHDDTPIEIDRTVAILVSHFGFYSLNAARIVYVIDEANETQRFGFAYGTLTEHSEIGEERFSVEFDPVSGEVWYDLFAFSRPGSLLVRVGYPLSRYLQRSFARDSKLAMLNAVSGASGSR